MTGPPPPGAALPSLLVVTDRTQVPAGRTLVDQVRGCIAGGARAVLLREKDLPRDARRTLALELRAVLDPVDGLLIVASDRYLAAGVGAAGCHGNAASKGYWRAKDPSAVTASTRAERRALIAAAKAWSGVWGISCHAGDDLFEAVDAGAHYVTLSPVFPTPSKPGYGPALGLDGLTRAAVELRDLCGGVDEAYRVRLIALGGIDTPEAARACIDAGADGVAVMGALMRADDPGALAGALVAALSRTAVP